MGLVGQVFLVLWKNWILQRRRICVSIFEIILPPAFASLIMLLRMIEIGHSGQTQPTLFDRQHISSGAYFGLGSIGYIPKTPETDILMTTVKHVMVNNSYDIVNVRGFATEELALDYMKNNEHSLDQLLVFENVYQYDQSLPLRTKFQIKPSSDFMIWNTDKTYPTYQTSGPRQNGSDSTYRHEGIISLQYAVGEALTKYWLAKAGGDPDSAHLGLYVQAMAYPPYYEDVLIPVVQNFLPMFLTLSFVISIIINTKNLVYEKEQKLKESMKLMGLHASVHWISWFITFSIYTIPVMALYTVFLCCHIASEGPVLPYSDPLLFFTFLMCYGVAINTFCFMVSTFVQKANIGAVFAGCLFFASFGAYLFYVRAKYQKLGRLMKLVSALSFNVAMGLGINIFGIHEGTGEGAKWENINEPAVVDDNITLLDCIVMLLIDSVLHCIIAWYLDNVWPGEFGVPEPFYFPFTKTYWLGTGASAKCNVDLKNLDSKNFEKDPESLLPGIQISKLRKVFGNQVSVAGTSLNIYEGQITVLLGHNGAGKTTTMSMLTGFIPPTSGTAVINGHDIRKNIQGVRSSLGLCPQHDILFDTLTVKEHLIFFAKLKGLACNQVNLAVQETAKDLELEHKLNYRAGALSGGQKRKLSVGIALIGGSKVVILDEPTAGMDPGARRHVWGVLKNARQDRTILLSTHYMDEADLLGDRIAIMAEGVVKCCGTSLFLKKRYGAGYHLVVVKDSNCNLDTLTQVLQSHIASTELEAVVNAEVTFLLPDSESPHFPALFNDLEERKEALGITSFGISATTMEEVFLKVGESAIPFEEITKLDQETYSNDIMDLPEEHEKSSDREEASPLVKTNSRSPKDSKVDSGTSPNSVQSRKEEETVGEGSVPPETTADSNTQSLAIQKRTKLHVVKTKKLDLTSFNKGFTKNKGLSFIGSKMLALFIKKILITWRSKLVTLVMLLLPLIFMTLGVSWLMTSKEVVQEPPLTFDLSPFDGTLIPYTAGNNATQKGKDFSAVYAAQFSRSESLEEFTMPPYQTFSNYTLDRAHELGLATFNKRMVIGMEVIEPEEGETLAAVSYYNVQPYHSEPIAMNYLMNAYLQAMLNSSYSLQFSMVPLPSTATESATGSIAQSYARAFFFTFVISIGMSFLTSFFIYFFILERKVGAKHLQVVSGVDPLTYWLPTFLWDLIIYLVPCLLMVVILVSYSVPAYTEDGRSGLVVLIFLSYGWAILPLLYVLQFMFSSPPTGVSVMIVLNIITGLKTVLAVSILQTPSLKTQDTADLLDAIFKITLPNYNMVFSFLGIFTNYDSIKQCKDVVCSFLTRHPCCPDTCRDSCISFELNYLAWDHPGVGSYVVSMACQGFLFIVILMIIEYRLSQRLWYSLSRFLQQRDPYDEEDRIATEDSDVAAERRRIQACAAQLKPGKNAPDCSDSLILLNLFKRYGNLVAVHHISVGVPEKECFGLLGQNGAGKTTIFKMLTGDVMVTGGNAYLKGFDVRRNIKQVQANMGYCPQFDALIDRMTGRETLTMYARLRGVPGARVNTVVNQLMDILMLEPHADKQTSQYSGGNKRKLSTAIALVGNPPFIMLDEPSAGMDPKARRQLWNVLSQVRASGRTLVLTSHSMEECDALCTRIAIMVNGRFICLGSPQHLKNKFAQGYTLILKMCQQPDGNPAPNQQVVNAVTQTLPGTTVFGDHQGYLHFQVPDSGVKLAQVFSLMEQSKQMFNVEDYSVHQTTLEQIFLSFARSQIPPKE